MTRRVLLSALASAIAVVAMVASVPRESVAATTNILAVANAECNIYCADCINEYHKTWEDPEYRIYSGTAHDNCQPGGCSLHNDPACWLAEQQSMSVGEALLALRTGSHGSPETLAAKYPSRFAINNAQQAVQVLNCKGQVVAHIPLGYEGLATNGGQLAVLE